jgi:tetratricopeptide (TPR) repeat protein
VMQKYKWVCAECTKEGAKHRCPCLWESYCGETCQKKMWQTHKLKCTVFLSQELANKGTGDGDGSAEVVEATMTLANIIVAQDRCEEAEKRMLDALRIARDLWGNNNPNVAAILHDLGRVLHRQDKTLEAVVKFEESYDMYCANYGVNDIHIAPNRMSFGTLLGGLGLYEDAQQQFEQALELYHAELEKTGDEDWQMHISVCLFSIGSIHAQTDNFEMAMKKYREAFQIEGRLVDGVGLGLYDRMGDLLMYKVDLLVMEEKVVEAIEHIKKALPILKRGHGPRSVTTAQALVRLGGLYQKQRERT